MGTVYVFFADGFEEIEALTIVDVLRRANLKVEMISVTGEDVVTGAHEVPVICDARFDGYNFDDAEILILPGGMPGAGTLGKHEGLRQLILKFAEENKPVAAICAAPSVLGKMGLLKGKTVTCYPGFEQYLEGTESTGGMVEKDGNLITGLGPGAAMKFALTIVETLVGKEKAMELSEAMFVK